MHGGRFRLAKRYVLRGGGALAGALVAPTAPPPLARGNGGDAALATARFGTRVPPLSGAGAPATKDTDELRSSETTESV